MGLWLVMEKPRGQPWGWAAQLGVLHTGSSQRLSLFSLLPLESLCQTSFEERLLLFGKDKWQL